jgi:hypothetical protein
MLLTKIGFECGSLTKSNTVALLGNCQKKPLPRQKLIKIHLSDVPLLIFLGSSTCRLIGLFWLLSQVQLLITQLLGFLYLSRKVAR